MITWLSPRTLSSSGSLGTSPGRRSARGLGAAFLLDDLTAAEPVGDPSKDGVRDHLRTDHLTPDRVTQTEALRRSPGRRPWSVEGLRSGPAPPFANSSPFSMLLPAGPVHAQPEALVLGSPESSHPPRRAVHRPTRTCFALIGAERRAETTGHIPPCAILQVTSEVELSEPPRDTPPQADVALG